MFCFVLLLVGSITSSIFVSIPIAFFQFRNTERVPTSPFSSDIQNCGLDCLADDAFDFVGASNVTVVNIQQNAFVELPEQLLWGMNSVLRLYARDLIKLISIPGKFFFEQPQLFLIFFSGSSQIGVAQGLPDELLRGLTGLVYFSLSACVSQNFPNMDDLTVRTGMCMTFWPAALIRVCIFFNGRSVQSSTFFQVHLVS